MLLAGDTISITNSKFGFTDKYFRIENINYAKDCTATITANEYDDSFYSISAPTLPSVVSQDQRQGLQATPAAPSNLSASVADNVLGGINLAWTNGSGLTAANCFTEVWFHTSSLNTNQVESNGTKHPNSPPFPAKTLVDQIGKKDVARYYWVRSGKVVTLTSGGQNKQKILYSNFVGPANATTVAPTNVFGVSLSGESIFTDTSGSLSPSSITLVTRRDNSTGSVAYAAVNNSNGNVTLTSAGNTAVTLTSGWATTPPTFAAGNTHKYWYSYFRATEDTAGGNTASGSNLVFQASQQGIGFSGLVTFTSGNVINDGSGNTLSFGENGTTTIDGGKITTGTVAAARITISGKNISDLNNNSGFTTFDASDVQNAVTNNVTSIDGAKITTGTILANRLKLSGSGGITIGSFTNDSGFTNNDAANAAQSTADGKTTASAAASAANSASKTAGSVGGWSLSSTTITSGNITLNNSTSQIIISD
jgi:hypothetical protein